MKKMTVHTLAETLAFRTLAEPDPDREAIGCYTGDLLSWVMGKAKSDEVWVTIMTNLNIVAVATLTDVSCIVVAEEAEISPDVVKKAAEKGVNLYTSPLSAYELCKALAPLV